MLDNVLSHDNMLNHEIITNVADVNNIIDIFNLVSKISYTSRRGLVKLGYKEESVAAHMYKIAFLCIFINENLNLELDSYKCVLMAIMHDIAEVYIGDIIPNDNIDIKLKHSYEDAIINKIFNNKLGINKNSHVYQNFYDAYKEYIEQKTPESKLVKFIDKIDFFYELLRCENNTKHKDIEKLKELEKTKENIISQIMNYDWGMNSKKYIHILNFLIENKCKCIDLPIFYLFIK